MVNYALIGQIQAENDQIQRLAAEQGPDNLISRHRKLCRLAKKLRILRPDKPGFSLAYTILLISSETAVEQLQVIYAESTRDPQSLTRYRVQFERLQYQINLAVSMIV
ncbi:hypothetical protein [Spirosoma sp. KNUC1025]|uniref:hypothetical protein n=1 Tax=Spirosoma sp. KNUC1025 TaxID=2894082 RepID=UPI00386F50A6|nr:hypothetical protein LN737_18945 [Spirosoma sp. KNUC1025]